MAEIKVNTQKFVNGRMTIEREKLKDNNGDTFIIAKGIFTTHEYFEEINTLESERYLLQGIEVLKETFASNDYDIGYEFLVGNLIVKEDYIPNEIKELIEAIEYEDEDKQYFHSKNWNNALEIYEEILSSYSEKEEE